MLTANIMTALNTPQAVPCAPSPVEFYSAFFETAAEYEAGLLELWNSSRDYTSLMRSTVFPQIANRLGLCCYPGDYYTLDSIFYRERDTANFAKHLTYAPFISVALEHENESRGTAVEINKLQLFNATEGFDYLPGEQREQLRPKAA